MERQQACGDLPSSTSRNWFPCRPFICGAVYQSSAQPRCWATVRCTDILCYLRTGYRNKASFFNINLPEVSRPCLASGGLSTAFDRRGRGSVLDESVWDLWWTQWHWHLSWPSTSAFPCQYHSTVAPYLFIHLALALYSISQLKYATHRMMIDRDM